MSRLRFALGRLLQVVLRVRYLERGAMPLERLGTGYGGWWCCTQWLAPGQVALCAGAGEDVSFDVALNAKFGLRVLCVDPTPRAVRHLSGLLEAAVAGGRYAVEGGRGCYDLTGFEPARFEPVAAALWNADGTLRLYAPQDPSHVSHSALNLQHTAQFIEVPSRRVASLLAERGLRDLAVFKLDIEGAEYAVLDDLVAGDVRPAQVLVEFDELHSPLSPLALDRVARRIRALRAAGYALVAAERCNFVFVRRDARAVPP